MERKCCFFSFKNLLDQFYVICSILALLPMMTCGAGMVWLSSAYSSLLSNDTDINPLGRPASTEELSMIAGLPLAVGLIGPIFMMTLSEKVGRKCLLQILASGLLFSNIGLAFSTVVMYIIISRCCIMICNYSYNILCQVYISEIFEDQNRIKYLYIMLLMLPLGDIYGFFFGPLLPYRIFTLILVIPMLPFLLFFPFAPETPVYLLSKGKKDECIVSLKKLRRKCSKELEIELAMITDILKATNSSGTKSIFHIFKNKETRVGIFLALLLGVVPHASGMTTIKSFLGPLLIESGTRLSENTMTVSIGIVQVISILWISEMVGKIGRRTMLIWSSVCCGIPLLLWGFYFYIQHEDYLILYYVHWVPLISMIISTIMFSIGLGSLPMAILSEYFSSDTLAVGVSCTFCMAGITIFIFHSSFPFIVDHLGFNWCIWICSGNCFVVAFLIYLFLPETSGKSLLEVQEILRNY